MKSKRIIAIGGGEIKNYGTLEIDRYIAEEAKKIAGDRRACGFICSYGKLRLYALL